MSHGGRQPFLNFAGQFEIVFQRALCLGVRQPRQTRTRGLSRRRSVLDGVVASSQIPKAAVIDALQGTVDFFQQAHHLLALALSKHIA